jgi:hypothetical protein
MGNGKSSVPKPSPLWEGRQTHRPAPPPDDVWDLLSIEKDDAPRGQGQDPTPNDEHTIFERHFIDPKRGMMNRIILRPATVRVGAEG